MVDHVDSYRKLLEIIELVSDNDSKSYIYPYTIAFVTGLWHEYIQYDIEDNPSLFYQLVNIPISGIIERGEDNIIKRNKQLEKILVDKEVINLNLACIGQPDISYMCYFLIAKNYKMKNMIGLALSEKSKEDGMENLSLLVIDHKFKKDRKHNKYKEEIYGGEF